MDSLTFDLLIIFICLCFSAFFSCSETALTAMSRARMHALMQSGVKRAGLVLRLRDKKDELIGSILLGNNIVNIGAAARQRWWPCACSARNGARWWPPGC